MQVGDTLIWRRNFTKKYKCDKTYRVSFCNDEYFNVYNEKGETDMFSLATIDDFFYNIKTLRRAKIKAMYNVNVRKN
jgi:hypothetical protein